MPTGCGPTPVESDAPAVAARGQVQSVGRALDLLEALACGREQGLVELARGVGLQPSTAHRLLSTLAARGYVHQQPNHGPYVLADRGRDLSSHVDRRTMRLRAVAWPFMQRIRKISRETTNLVVLRGCDAVYVDQLKCAESVPAIADVGRGVPAHAAGAGKALLAGLSEQELDAVLGPQPLRGLTPQSLTTTRALAQQLADVRRRGWAVDEEEHAAGVTCVAAPLRDFAGVPVAAISVSGPTARLGGIGLDALGELLLDQTAACSRELGCPPEQAAPPTASALMRSPRRQSISS